MMIINGMITMNVSMISSAFKEKRGASRIARKRQSNSATAISRPYQYTGQLNILKAIRLTGRSKMPSPGKSTRKSGCMGHSPPGFYDGCCITARITQAGHQLHSLSDINLIIDGRIIEEVQSQQVAAGLGKPGLFDRIKHPYNI